MTRRHQPFNQDVALAALAGQLDELRADVTSLARVRRDVAAHTRALDDLAQLVRRTTTAGGPGVPQQGTGDPAHGGGTAGLDGDAVPDWMSVTDPAHAIAWLTDLTGWVPRIWARYPTATPPGCWPWHPPVVAELLVARHLWAEATLPGQGAAALAGWHDRWRPNAALRVTRAMSGCDRGGGCHVNVAGHHYTHDRAWLDELALWWATSDRADLDAAPGLTREDRHPTTRPVLLDGRR